MLTIRFNNYQETMFAIKDSQNEMTYEKYDK